jgi:phage virion morphogenesis protein
MGIGLKIEVKSSGLEKRLARLTTSALKDLMDSIGSLVEIQTNFRIESEKRDSEGKPWVPWSEDYEPTRHGNQSLLINKGDLQTSITHNVRGSDVEIGTNVIYGAVHQFGYKEIPARPYLGISKLNERELEQLIEDWLDGQMGL